METIYLSIHHVSSCLSVYYISATVCLFAYQWIHMYPPPHPSLLYIYPSSRALPAHLSLEVSALPVRALNHEQVSLYHYLDIHLPVQSPSSHVAKHLSRLFTYPFLPIYFARFHLSICLPTRILSIIHPRIIFISSSFPQRK